jgi:tetratricopeptide (TPR) repeat protein
MFKWLSRKAKGGPDGRRDGDSATQPNPVPSISQDNPTSSPGAIPPVISCQVPPLLPKTREQTAPPLLRSQLNPPQVGKPEAPNPSSPKADGPPIMVHDQDGHAYELSRTAFATKVLSKEFQDAANDPDRLYGALVMALQDGFSLEALEAAQRLFEIDPDRDRAAIMLGIAFMKNNKLDEAERVLSAQLARAKSGPLMVNLAKVWELLGREAEAHKLLREALSVNPNMDNGLMWHTTIARDQGGQEAYLKALRDVAREPGSWRAQLWLARDFLEHDDGAGALLIYRELMGHHDLPGDALMMVTGDLGNHGLVREMIELVLPVYDEKRHDILAGRNLLQACVDLGYREEGLALCDRLDRLERYDYRVWIDQQRATLSYSSSADFSPPAGAEAPPPGPGPKLYRWIQDPAEQPCPAEDSAPPREPPPKLETPKALPPALRSDLPPEFKKELTKELEIGGGKNAADFLSVGIGLIKTGAHKLLPGWLRLFGKSDVFIVSVEQNNPQTAFVFGPKGDWNYVAVFLRLELAQECLREFPILKVAMRLNGLDLLRLARDARKGIWINPLNEACSVRFPADMMERFIEEASREGS